MCIVGLNGIFRIVRNESVCIGIFILVLYSSVELFVQERAASCVEWKDVGALSPASGT
jgi:hypothetical protein